MIFLIITNKNARNTIKWMSYPANSTSATANSTSATANSTGATANSTSATANSTIATANSTSATTSSNYATTRKTKNILSSIMVNKNCFLNITNLLNYNVMDLIIKSLNNFFKSWEFRYYNMLLMRFPIIWNRIDICLKLVL